MITMEMIDQFRKRTNCSYQEAKMYLERNNGNLVDAIVDFERTHSKINFEEKSSKLKDFFAKAYRTRFIIENKGTTILNLSILFLALFVLFTIPALPIIIISMVIALLLGYKFKIVKHTGSNVDINKFFSDVTQNTKNGTPYNPNNGQNNNNDKSDEYTVE